MCEHLNRPEYISLQYDEQRREEIIQDFRSIFLSKSVADWDSELAEMEICFAVVKTMEEILTDPQLCEREMIHSYPGENGEQKHGFGIPVKLSDTPGSIRTAAREIR